MKPENILDAIGNVDDTCIKEAKEKKKSQKTYWISISALAACLALVVGVPYISKTMNGIGKNPVIVPPDTQNPQYAFSYIRVFYNFNSKSKIAPRQNTLENTEMDKVLEYIETIIESREGISYKNDEWEHEVQEKDVSINCIDFENKLQAEYLLTTNSLFDYQTNTEYTLSEEEVQQLKALCIK